MAKEAPVEMVFSHWSANIWAVSLHAHSWTHFSELLISFVTPWFLHLIMILESFTASTDLLDSLIWPDQTHWLWFTCQETLTATQPDTVNTWQSNPQWQEDSKDQENLNQPAESTDLRPILHWEESQLWLPSGFSVTLSSMKWPFQECWFCCSFQWVLQHSSFHCMLMQVRQFWFCFWLMRNSHKREEQLKPLTDSGKSKKKSINTTEGVQVRKKANCEKKWRQMSKNDDLGAFMIWNSNN